MIRNKLGKLVVKICGLEDYIEDEDDKHKKDEEILNFRMRIQSIDRYVSDERYEYIRVEFLRSWAQHIIEYMMTNGLEELNTLEYKGIKDTDGDYGEHYVDIFYTGTAKQALLFSSSVEDWIFKEKADRKNVSIVNLPIK